MKNILLITLSILLFSCAQEKRLIHKAEVATGRMQYDKAIAYYDKVLEKNNNSYRANAGKGILLSEYTEKYDQAIPYLEKALSKTQKDTLMTLNYNLGKSYHNIGNYNRAIFYYGKLKNYTEVGNPDFDLFLSKRIADCKYALAHPQVASANDAKVVSVGQPINTDMPEYGAIAIGSDLIFTSKRKDDSKEKKNEWDGKYFESMYISNWKEGKYSEPRRYTLPDLNERSKFRKHNEAVISASHDGKKLFIYRDAKIYEASINDSAKNPDKMNKTINFAHFQNHAYLSGDGNRLFFTSESKTGMGGTDIYTSIKKGEEWSAPELLDTGIVNTYFNEDAPYYSENGTLFFSSNGLPGYGGYDIYKTHLEDGHWTIPENLGLPINSPGDDIFFVLNGNTPNGYFASSRTGGAGDMDIYKVHYISTETPDCKTINDPLLAINATKDTSDNLNYRIELQFPEEYNLRYCIWKINDSLLPQTYSQFQYTFNSPGTYTLSAKGVIQCDTCATLLARCAERKITIGNEVFAAIDSISQYMNDTQLSALRWNTSPIYFDYDKYALREDARIVLDQNIDVLKKNTELTFIVNGYADSRGTEKYNKDLSSKRANAVSNYLVKNGIAKSRIKGTYANGETMLTNNCNDIVFCDEAAHQKNRRVEFKVINVQKLPLATAYTQ